MYKLTTFDHHWCTNSVLIGESLVPLTTGSAYLPFARKSVCDHTIGILETKLVNYNPDAE
jgi:hypothetical protein